MLLWPPNMAGHSDWMSAWGLPHNDAVLVRI